MIDPVKKTVTVPLSAPDAFELFTRRIDEWWPMDTHSVAATTKDMPPSKRLEFEPKEGGKLIEKLADGTDAVWAEVTRWDPGQRFELKWFPGQPEDLATRVDVTFTTVPGGTLVHLVHDGFDARLDAAQTARDNYNTGWEPVMSLYSKAASLIPA